MTAHRIDLVIATMTRVANPQEGRMLHAALEALSRLGHPVVVTDGGSSEEFLSFVRALPGVTLAGAEGPGLVNQIRASLRASSEMKPRVVLYTEPDKLDFFEHHLQAFLEISLQEEAGIVIAARSPESFETFPPLQRSTEETINGLCGEFLGVEGDYSYGPFLLRKELEPYLESITTDLGWGWRHYLFAVTQRLGRGIAHRAGDFACPKEQRVEGLPERIHRLRQLAQNVSGLVAGFEAELDRSSLP